MDVPGLEGHVGCGRGALRPNADLPIYSTSYLIYAQVAQGVAAIMLRNKLKVPDALAVATTAGVRDPPKGFDRKIVHGKLKLVASDGAVALRPDDAYAAAASMKADTSLTPKAALDAARTARLELKGLVYSPTKYKGDMWFLAGAPEPITRLDHAEALSARLVDVGLVDRRYDADERVKVAFDETVREYYAVKGLDYEWFGGENGGRVYFIEGCAGACSSLRIRSHDDARACSRELVAGHFVGWGLLHPCVRKIFEKYATDAHGRTQAVRDAEGVVVRPRPVRRGAAMATLFGDVSDLYDRMAPTAVIGEHVDMTIVTTPRIDSLFAAPPPSRVAAAPPSRGAAAPPARERVAAAGTRSSGRERRAPRTPAGMLSTDTLDFRRVRRRRRLD